MTESDIRENHRFSVNDVDFVTGFTEQPVDAYTIVKSPEMLARYESLLSRHECKRILEVGMAFGGAMVWLNEVARPERLIGMDIRETPIAALERYIAGLGDGKVSAHYGIDQADREAVRQVIDDGFAGEAIDLVIDDASHMYDPSLTLFEVVFPYVRPGGIYLIEDWKWESELAYAISTEIARGATIEPPPPASAPPIPLTKFALDLLIARAETLGVIDSVEVNNSWLVVTRGSAPIDASSFKVSDLAKDFHALLA